MSLIQKNVVSVAVLKLMYIKKPVGSNGVVANAQGVMLDSEDKKTFQKM
jgi:hypothetical protein